MAPFLARGQTVLGLAPVLQLLEEIGNQLEWIAVSADSRLQPHRWRDLQGFPLRPAGPGCSDRGELHCRWIQ